MKYEINGKKFNYPEIIMIVAMTESGLVGSGDKMPWKSSFDFEWFKRNTIGFPMIFGRKTALGMPQFPLQNRPCAILSNEIHEPFVATKNGIATCHDDLMKAIEHYKNFDKVFIAGGKSVYQYALQEYKPFGQHFPLPDITVHLPLVDTVIRTKFPDGHASGDVYFTELDAILREQFSLSKTGPFALRNTGDSKQQYEYGHTCEECEEYEGKPCPMDADTAISCDFKYDLKKNDTPFPWVRFEIFRRNTQNGK